MKKDNELTIEAVFEKALPIFGGNHVDTTTWFINPSKDFSGNAPVSVDMSEVLTWVNVELEKRKPVKETTSETKTNNNSKPLRCSLCGSDTPKYYNFEDGDKANISGVPTWQIKTMPWNKTEESK